MENSTFVFVAGMFLSAITGRTMLLAMRGGIERPLNISNAVRDIIGTVGGFCFYVLIVWAFSSLDWYFALPAILTCGFFGGLVVNRSRFALFFVLEPVIDLITIGITAWLWIRHWPY